MAQDKQYTVKQHSQLTKTATYFQRSLPYMDYGAYLKRGWPIASGVIEGACRHFVKDRCELSGMRWTQTGVENLLRYELWPKMATGTSITNSANVSVIVGYTTNLIPNS